MHTAPRSHAGSSLPSLDCCSMTSADAQQVAQCAEECAERPAHRALQPHSLNSSEAEDTDSIDMTRLHSKQAAARQRQGQAGTNMSDSSLPADGASQSTLGSALQRLKSLRLGISTEGLASLQRGLQSLRLG